MNTDMTTADQRPPMELQFAALDPAPSHMTITGRARWALAMKDMQKPMPKVVLRHLMSDPMARMATAVARGLQS